MCETQVCKCCNQELPIDNFKLVHRAKSTGWRRKECTECTNENAARAKGPESYKKYKEEKAYRKELHILQKQGQRRCRICKEVKSLDDFHSDSSGKVFYNKKSYCKKCARSKYRIPYYNTERGKESKRKADQRYLTNKGNARRRERYKNEPLLRLKAKIRSDMLSAFEGIGDKKNTRSIEALGLKTWVEFENYLKSKFYNHPTTGEEMSLEKHGSGPGKWQLDHIEPLMKAKNKQDIVRLSHYTNLQPLWTEDHIKKTREDKDKYLNQ